MVVGAPLHAERAAVHHYVRLAPGPVGESCRHCCRAGTCAARHGDAAAALPHSHPYGGVIVDASELYVAPLRERGVALQQRTARGHLVDVVGKDNIVRIAHRHEGAGGQSLRRDKQRLVGCNWLQHIDGHALYLVVTDMELQGLNARQCLQTHHGLVGQSTLVEIFAYASRGIAAHHRFAAIGIEYAHGEVGVGGAAYQHQSVGTDALVAVAPSAGSL